MTKAHWQRLALTMASGLIMAALQFDPGRSDQGSIQFAGSLLLLLIALHGAGPRWGFRLGFIWGILAYGITLSWLWTIFQGISAGLWSILAIFTAVFGSWFGTVTGGGEPRPFRIPFRGGEGSASPGESAWVIPLAAVVWTGIEYFRCEWFTLRFPWITPGTIMGPNVLTPFIGTYGVTFLVILGVALLASRRARRPVTRVLLAVPVLLLFILLHFFPPKPAGLAPDEAIDVALVQSEACYFDAYRDLTAAIDRPVDAIVWPEYALSYDIRLHPTDFATCRGLLQKTGAKTLTLGSRTDLDMEGGFHNTAVTIGPDGTLGAHYKNRPVHFFSDGEPGRTQESFSTPIGPIATPICFDCDYTEVVRRQVRHGAQLLLVPSMDAERWTARQHEQHAQLFRHRAAENGRWTAVAATSGVSQIIDPTGHVVERLPTMTEGVLIGRVGLRSELTFYTRFGWILGPACAFAAAAIILATIIVRFRGRASPPSAGSRTPSPRDPVSLSSAARYRRSQG